MQKQLVLEAPSVVGQRRPNEFLAQLQELAQEEKIATPQGSGDIRYFFGEFWTSKQRKCNRLHEISYRACFKPQLPAFFMDHLTSVGDVVHDPFMGRGTTPVEAALKGRIPYGSDINPLSKAFAEPRLKAPSQSDVAERLGRIPWDRFKEYQHDELLTFFHPATLCEIEGLRNWLFERQKSGAFDHVDNWIRMIAMNRLTGHSAGFFSVYTFPPNQAISIERQRTINERRKQKPERRDVPRLIMKKNLLLQKDGVPHVDDYLLLTCKSDETDEIASDSVRLTVTSPPFLNIVNYEADNWMRCWFLGVDAKKIHISSHRSVEPWRAFIASTLKEIYRITVPGGYVALEVGEVRNRTVNLEEHVIEAAGESDFEIVCVMINQQYFTKTSNCWGVGNNALGTNTNRIVVLQKTS